MVQRLLTSGNGKVVAIDLPCTKEDCKRPQPHNTHGTAHCVQLAEKAGLPVEHVLAPVEVMTRQPQSQRQSPVRHSWQGKDSVRVCEHDGCGMVATRHWQPDARRPVTIYSKDGRAIVAERVPPCGQPLPEAKLDRPARQQMATELDRLAGHALKAGNPDRAARLLADCRVLDPSRSELWDRHERVLHAWQQRARQAAKPDDQQRVTEPNIWLGQFAAEKVTCNCGGEFIRPQGADYSTCLKCETAGHWEKAGTVGKSPEPGFVGRWNERAAERHQQREAERLEAERQSRIRAEQKSESQPARDMQPQMEAAS
jgi:hypothetical protein